MKLATLCSYLIAVVWAVSAHADVSMLADNVAVQEHKGAFFFSDSISLVGSSTSDHKAMLRSNLPFAPGQKWEFAIDVKNHPNVDGSMSVHLETADGDVAWVGCDAYYKMFTAFLGSGKAQTMPFTQHWDDNWHRVVYACDGNSLVVWVDWARRKR